MVKVKSCRFLSGLHRVCVENGQMEMDWIPMTENRAGMFSKALGRELGIMAT